MSARERSLTIGDKHLHDESDCYVIAEIGHNHQGNIETAMKMFREAHKAGADAVKLQKRDNKALFTREMYDQPYHSENAYGPTYGLHREALEFGKSEYQELQDYAGEVGIQLFATPFDFPSVDFLAEMDMPAYKVASADLQNTPLLEYIAKVGKPILVSTGGGTLDDVRRAFDAIIPHNDQICIMQCTAAYPAEADILNLRVIETYRDEFPDCTVGLSDHQNGISMALVAYTLGARVVEKHFTLNRAMKGSDHSFSLEPLGLTKLVRDLRRARLALGSPKKQMLPCESAPLHKMGKQIVAARDLPGGHVLRREDLMIKSPGGGLPPYELHRLVGKPLLRPVAEDESIMFEHLGAVAPTRLETESDGAVVSNSDASSNGATTDGLETVSRAFR